MHTTETALVKAMAMKVRKISTPVDRHALPSRITISTHLMLSSMALKGAEKLASAWEKEMPTSAYLMAEQSFAPSPVIATQNGTFCRHSTISLFYSGLARANTAVLQSNCFIIYLA